MQPWEPDFDISHVLPITAGTFEAKRFFAVGVVHMYGFNRHEALKAFRAAIDAEVGCAMCHWGIAFANGPTANEPNNLNIYDAFREAHKARDLIVEASGVYARVKQKRKQVSRSYSQVERGLINAMSLRYSVNGSSVRNGWQRYAESLNMLRQSLRSWSADVDTFYADQLMSLMRSEYYMNQSMGHSGPPKPETSTALAVLQGVLKRTDHPFAMHLYIHLTEARTPGTNGGPEIGETVADRLSRMGSNGSGHLVHMPAHTYNRVGRYDDAVKANIRAYAEDELYKKYGSQPYLADHNLLFLVWSAEMDGQSSVALKYGKLNTWETWIPLATLVRFGDFAAVLSDHTSCLATPCYYARGLAWAGLGDVSRAKAELRSLQRALPAREGFVQPCAGYWRVINCLANKTLSARVALLNGDGNLAVSLLEEAVKEENAIPYDEPPSWHYPTRQCLGAVLLSLGEARKAEFVFRADLEQWWNNAWSLKGLGDAMAAQPSTYSGAAVEQALAKVKEHWSRADRPLTSACMAFNLNVSQPPSEDKPFTKNGFPLSSLIGELRTAGFVGQGMLLNPWSLLMFAICFALIALAVKRRWRKTSGADSSSGASEEVAMTRVCRHRRIKTYDCTHVVQSEVCH